MPLNHCPPMRHGMRWALALGAVLWWSGLDGARATAVDPAAEAAGAAPLFEREVLPILTQHCLKCHGLEACKAGLDLRTMSLVRRGGESGPVLPAGDQSAGDQGAGTLLERVLDRSMPPEGELPLSHEKIDTIRRWIEAGAPALEADDAALAAGPPEVSDADREYWAFRTPIRQPPPTVRQADQVRTPIDAFLLARLEAQGLTFSPEADKHTLARRASLDLIGLPPSPEEAAAFVEDSSSNALERLIDRLLDSPHFGERWGRHWLDAAGYTDTIGDDTDAAITKVAAGKWRYRDYVVHSFNAGKPFDRFIVEQIAGDELFDWRRCEAYTAEQQELLVATGFLRMAPDETLQNELNTADIRHAVLEHTMEIAMSSLLGLTVGCARCHSHKFDPIPQEDYYRLLSAFTPAYNPQTWLQPAARELPDVPPAEKARIEAHNADLDRQVEQVQQQVAAIHRPYRDRLFSERLATLPEPIRADCKAALETPTEMRTEVQKYLAEKFEGLLQVSAAEIAAALSEADRSAEQSLYQQIAALGTMRRSWGVIQAVYDSGPPPPTFLLRRGNHETPGREVTPGFLRVLCESESSAWLPAEPPYDGASGRRLALAQRLIDPASPASGLMARVYVNRAWQQLFGQGIVATAENFGRSGAAPTHPELLDWLAVEFISSGWQIKPLLKLMIQSTAYRQASAYGAIASGVSSHPNCTAETAAETVDPDNELLWRMRLRPIEAEIVRDSILSVSGNLDRGAGGPPIMHESGPGGIVNIKLDALPTPSSQFRRSFYLLVRHRYHLSLLETFDQPEVAGACLRRTHAPVVSQSLTMLNDPWVVQQSRTLAERVLGEAPGGSRADRIDRAFRIVLCRPPRAAEAEWAAELLARQAERHRPSSATRDEAELRGLGHVCHMLLNASEFLYIH